MLECNATDTSAVWILTLTESVSLPDANYLFVLVHATTRDVVAFVKTQDDDESLFQDRYNQFTINPSQVFPANLFGEWHYRVHEQASLSNIDELQSGAVLEYGKLILHGPEFSFTKYDASTNFKTYNG